MSSTAIVVGTLRTEQNYIYIDESGRVAVDERAPDVTLYRPIGVGLGNDGFHPWWGQEGITYLLAFRDERWYVTYPGSEGHEYHLASMDQTPVRELELIDGSTVGLDPETQYEMRSRRDGEGFVFWDLVA